MNAPGEPLREGKGRGRLVRGKEFKRAGVALHRDAKVLCSPCSWVKVQDEALIPPLAQRGCQVYCVRGLSDPALLVAHGDEHAEPLPFHIIPPPGIVPS